MSIWADDGEGHPEQFFTTVFLLIGIELAVCFWIALWLVAT